MKRFYLLPLFLMVAFFSYGQEKASVHEFVIGYGINPIASLPKHELPKDPMTGGSYLLKNKEFSGTLNVGYFYHLSEPFAIGLTYSYGKAEHDVVIGSSIPLAKVKNDIHTLMLSGKYTWLNLRNLYFYSRVGIGVLSAKNAKIKETEIGGLPSQEIHIENKNSIAWQVMPIGIDWQFAKPMALFLEGGAGANGCVLMGVKVLF